MQARSRLRIASGGRVVLFAAAHASGFGTKQTYRGKLSHVRFRGQSGRAARVESVAV